jgi:hypothetical protein
MSTKKKGTVGLGITEHHAEVELVHGEQRPRMVHDAASIHPPMPPSNV